jgi:hypothetical protein
VARRRHRVPLPRRALAHREPTAPWLTAVNSAVPTFRSLGTTLTSSSRRIMGWRRTLGFALPSTRRRNVSTWRLGTHLPATGLTAQWNRKQDMSVVDDLSRLAGLRERGDVSAAEYKQAKQRVLGAPQPAAGALDGGYLLYRLVASWMRRLAMAMALVALLFGVVESSGHRLRGVRGRDGPDRRRCLGRRARGPSAAPAPAGSSVRRVRRVTGDPRTPGRSGAGRRRRSWSGRAESRSA